MKKLIIGFFAVIASLNLFAQTDESQTQNATVAVKSTVPEGITLKDGHVLIYENGNTILLTEEIWTKRGMQVTPSGTIIFANGEKANLREGDFVTMDGAVARPIPLKGKDNAVAYNRR